MEYGLYKNKRYSEADLLQVRKDVSTEIIKMTKKLSKMKKEDFFSEGFSFYFYGDYRVGKTWLLHAIANHFIKNWNVKSLFFLSTAKLVSYFFNNSFNTQYGTSWINVLSQKKVLFLDDLGQDNYTTKEFIPSKMDAFLRYRFNNNLVTFISSNFNPDELEDKYNKSLKEFILGEYLILKINGENVSKKLKKEKLGIV